MRGKKSKEPLPRKLKLKEEWKAEAVRRAQKKYGIERHVTSLAENSKVRRKNGLEPMSRQTAWRFLSGELISFYFFDVLCETLSLDWKQVGEEKPSVGLNHGKSAPKDTGEQSAIAGPVSKAIQNICGSIQLFGRAVSIDRYVPISVYELDLLPIDRYEAPDLLSDEFMIEKIDREQRKQYGLSTLPCLKGLEAARKHQYLLVYGGPGSGKTSYLKWIATQCKEGNLFPQLFPVFFFTRNFKLSEEGINLVSLVEEFFQKCGVPKAKQTVDKLLRQGRILLILDGLDEVHEKYSAPTYNSILETINAYPKCRYVFSCRLPLTLPFYKFQKVLIAGFDNTQRREFVRQWFEYKYDNAELAHAFLGSLPKHKALSELTRSPLLLELLCRVFRTDRTFPPTRAELYYQGINALLRDERNRLPQNDLFYHINQAVVLRFLQQIAASFFTRERPMLLLDKGEILQRIDSWFIPALNLDIGAVSASKILDGIELTYGLLINHSASFCVFSHLTFQEYFTAYHLVRTGEYNTVLNHITDSKWRFIIELTAEILLPEKQEAFFKVFKQSLDSLIQPNPKLCQFLEWIDLMAEQNQYIFERETPHQKTLLRAWYFCFTLADTYVASNVGRISSPFILPSFDLATSMVTCPMLTTHAQFYQAFHATRSSQYQRFEQAVLKIRESVKTTANDTNRAALKLLNQLDGWAIQIEAQQANFTNKALWWEGHRAYWKERIRYLMQTLHGLQNDWNFTEAEEQSLRKYYEASRLLSICTVRAVKRLQPSYRQQLVESLLSIPLTNREFPNP